ncbi:DUF2550 domain-containing protein [Gordonia sp. HY285]|uniref:DUF2550 domain-containing protein n=1 Tax=Gordonia liuliyuniae TaxID=2911517 RepID=A0ABS9IXC8_9ACTN|nr:DUF2550 domain-containing protein [Gordonia liuliyuniae]MCF8590211.1 DUF2550 domain-containing protein [Gordonia liuliyuniae]MCF8611878.1 DUF2550 domain-containing protein [Gordonia liuliyuniae]
MPMWAWIVCGLLLVGLIAAGLLVYRLRLVRLAGTPVLLRPLPADADEGWRHGSIHYTDDAILYFRLSSLRLGPSVTLSRRRIEVSGRRSRVGTESEIMDPDMVVAEITVGRRGQEPAYELAMAPAAMTAFQSWLEARAPRRARRRPAA